MSSEQGDEAPSERGLAEPEREVDAPLFPGWIPAIVALVLAPCFAVKVKTYDVWWHMATGRWMAEHGRLPTTDPFSYTVPGKPWRLVNGLADLVLYGAYRLGGASALVVLKVIFAWITLTLLGLCLRALRCSRATVIGLVALTALLVHGRYTFERPMIMGASLLVACQLAMIRSHRLRDRSHLFFLAALPLWPLVHGTALLGAAQLGALLVAGLVARAPRRYLVSVAGTAAACLVLSFVLPWWRDLYYVARGVGGGATATMFTAEWQSGIEALPNRVGHWAVVAGGIAGGLLHARRDASLLILPLVGTAISARFGRNSYEAVLLAMPSFGLALEALSERLRGASTPILARSAAPLAAFAIGAVQLALAPLVTIGAPFGFGVLRGRYPSDTLATLRRLPQGRVFNDFPTGGYLIWHQVPGGVYCDGRTVALYDEEDVKRLFLPMLESSEALTAAADRWDAVYGLAENESHPLNWMMISPDWVPLHLGLATSLFVRKSRLAALPPEAKPLHLVRYSQDRRWMDGWYAGIVADPPLRAQLLAEMAEAARLGPHSPLLVEIVLAASRLDRGLGQELAKIVEAAGGG